MDISKVTERFLKYVQVDTQSDEQSDTFPSTLKQHELAKMLASELRQMGAQEVCHDEIYGYVYAQIPSNSQETQKVLGFIAHMDTSPEMSGTSVHPQIVKNYDGGEIELGTDSDGKKVLLRPTEFPELLDYIGQDLITTDGTTLLGADDKAGIAEIMTMAEYLLTHPEIKHGRIALAFTPDEEIGAGMDHFDLKRFPAEYAYTVDGGGIGELEYENFNAASARIVFSGRNVHPGEAKGKMIHAARLALEFDSRLPQQERAEYTSGYEGFFHLTHLSGSVEEAVLEYIIRDHDKKIFEERRQRIFDITEELNKQYGSEYVKATVTDQYYNMKEKIEPVMFLIENARSCMEKLGIEPKVQPIRGGTDGARLSFMGVPCPNLCTGGHNYHGRYEYCCIQSMEAVVRLLTELARD